jgi:L-gulonate 5-dehydrogenase
LIAARTIEKETIRFDELPSPEPVPGEAVIRVLHVTLCGTDLHIWEDDYATELPIIQGHEFVARIEALAPGAQTSWKVGDRVAVSPMIYCGECYACRSGRYNACRNMSVYGCYEDGSLVELMSVPLDKLHAIPAVVPTEIASLCEPTSIAMQAVRRGRPVPGEKALVLGCGPIGLLATLCLADLGVEVIAADTVPERAGFAEAFGAAHALVVDPRGPFPDAAQTELLASATAGQGPSLVIEATGMPDSLTNALRLVANAGRVVSVGISTREARLPMNVLPTKELDLLGSRNSLDLIDDSLELMSRNVGVVAGLITHRFPLDALARAFERMRSRDEVVGKIAIDMPGARR